MRILREDLDKVRKYGSNIEVSLRNCEKSKDAFHKQCETNSVELQKLLGEMEKWKKKYLESESKPGMNEHLESKIKHLGEEAEKWRNSYNDAELEWNAKTLSFEKKVFNLYSKVYFLI